MNQLSRYIAVFLLIVAGCGGKAGVRTDWLAVIGSDTVFVQDAADIWNGLEDSARNQFLQDQDPSMSFLNTIIEKKLMEMGAADAGYLESDLFKAMRSGWIRTQMSILQRRRMESRMASEVTDSEISDLLSRKYDMVHITMMPDTPREAPASIPFVELPYEQIVQIDSMMPGDVGVDGMSNPFRLDSITRITETDSVFADVEAYTDSMLRVSISASRVRDRIREIENSSFQDYNVSIDTLALLGLCRYFADSVQAPPDSIVVDSYLGSWTGPELVAEVDIVQNVFPLNPEIPGQIIFLVRNMVRQLIMEEMLMEEYPPAIDSIALAADSYMMKAAVESLYVDSVLNRVVPGAGHLLMSGRVTGTHLDIPDNAGELIDERLDEVLSDYRDLYGVRLNDRLLDSLSSGRYVWELAPADTI